MPRQAKALRVMMRMPCAIQAYWRGPAICSRHPVRETAVIKDSFTCQELPFATASPETVEKFHVVWRLTPLLRADRFIPLMTPAVPSKIPCVKPVGFSTHFSRRSVRPKPEAMAPELLFPPLSGSILAV
jgi:hypothetical protein